MANKHHGCVDCKKTATGDCWRNLNLFVADVGEGVGGTASWGYPKGKKSRNQMAEQVLEQRKPSKEAVDEALKVVVVL